jgi:hypothetical protein
MVLGWSSNADSPPDEDGGLSIRNLDLAAHMSFFSGDLYSKELIPARAGKLALRLSQALTPFFNHPASDDAFVPEPSFLEAWVEDMEVLEQINSRLVALFTHALELKSVLLSSTCPFIIVFFPAGTLYDQGTMIAESRFGDRAIPLPTRPIRIELCILPAIYVSNQESLTTVNYEIEVRTGINQDYDDVRLLRRAEVVLAPRL